MDRLVSVGVPTYNRPEGLQKLLNCITEQTYSHLEIIISDNCSPNEEVRSVVQKYSNSDQRITAIFQTENLGAEENFNAVFNLARGEYFIWLGDDDYIDKDYIEKCVTFLDEHKEYSLCSGQTKYVNGDEQVGSEKRMSIQDSTSEKRLIHYFSQVEKNGVFYGVLRRNLLPKSPFKFVLGEDWNIVGALAWQGKLRTLSTTNLYRSVVGGSATRKQLRTRYELSRIGGVLFEFVLARNVSKDAFKLIPDVQLSKLKKAVISVRIWIIVVHKLGANFLNRFS